MKRRRGGFKVEGERVPCVVPFCRRTIAKHKISPSQEWVCAKHWRLVSAKNKAALRLTYRRARKIIRRKPEYQEYWKLPPGSPARLAAVNMWRRVDQAWDRCVTEAIETAGGIA